MSIDIGYYNQYGHVYNLQELFGVIYGEDGEVGKKAKKIKEKMTSSHSKTYHEINFILKKSIFILFTVIIPSFEQIFEEYNINSDLLLYSTEQDPEQLNSNYFLHFLQNQKLNKNCQNFDEFFDQKKFTEQNCPFLCSPARFRTMSDYKNFLPSSKLFQYHIAIGIISIGVDYWQEKTENDKNEKIPTMSAPSLSTSIVSNLINQTLYSDLLSEALLILTQKECLKYFSQNQPTFSHSSSSPTPVFPQHYPSSPRVEKILTKKISIKELFRDFIQLFQQSADFNFSSHLLRSFSWRTL